jgi:hypothetical protein
MNKTCIKAYLPKDLAIWLAFEANRRNVSMSKLVTVALLSDAWANWLLPPASFDEVLNGQSELFATRGGEIDASDEA